jgi:Ca-activated chloride channel family protein
MIKLFFDNPVYLWYLISVPVLIVSHFFFLKKAKFKALKFSNFNTIKRITGKGEGKIMTRNWNILILRLIIVLCLILTISGPVLWYKSISHDKDFVIAIDSSASMLATDFEPNRLGAAKQEAIKFVSGIKGNSKIGVIDFAGNAFIDQVLTDDKSKVIDEIEIIGPMPLGGTDLAGAIISGANLMITNERGRVMILISDGSNTVDAFNMRALDSALQYTMDNQIIINTIGIGSNTGPIGYLPEYYNITAVYDSEQLKHIANVSEGKFYDGNNMTSFSSAFTEILVDTQSTYVKKDIRPILLLIGLLALFLEWGLLNTRYRKLP